MINMKKAIVTLVIGTSLAGCAAVQNEDGSTKKAATYGGGAALVGGIAGALMGNTRGAVIGAGLAGAAGVAYGHYVDNQEAALRKSMSGTGVMVQREGDQLKLVMPGAITFATNKADIQPSFYDALSRLSNSFRQFPSNNLVITGYTDATGGAALNQQLSQERADSVGQYLRSNGVDPSRIQTVGAGPSMPVASNDTEAGRAQNRRVEIRLTPTPEQQQQVQQQMQQQQQQTR